MTFSDYFRNIAVLDGNKLPMEYFSSNKCPLFRILAIGERL